MTDSKHESELLLNSSINNVDTGGESSDTGYASDVPLKSDRGKGGKAVGTNSTIGTFFNVFLGYFGIGLLTIPYGFKYVGMVGGPVLILIVALISWYCFIILIRTKNLFHQRGLHYVLTYQDIGYEAFGKLGTYLVNIAIVANQIGMVSAYQQFIGKNLVHIYPNPIPLYGWILLWCVIVIPLSLVRQMKYFSFTSIFGLLCLVFTVVSVLVNGALHGTPPDPIPLGPDDLFLFLGIAAFGYAAVAVSSAQENTMAKPQDFPALITIVFIGITIVYCGFGMAAFYFYGDNVQAIISCNIQNPLGYAVKAGLIAQLTVSLPLNTYPIWIAIEGEWAVGRFWLVNIVRSVSVVIMAVLAFSIPYFGDFSNLIGAIATSFMTWIIPPAIHLKAYGRSLGLGYYLADVASITFGLSILISSTTFTIFHLISEINAIAPISATTC